MDISNHPNVQRYSAWFKFVDSDGDGQVTGAEAKTLFPRSRLGKQTLAVIWSLCDEGKTGRIDLEQFVKAMELVTIAQAGSPVSNEEWLLQLKDGIQPPTMDGLNEACGIENLTADNPFGEPEAPKRSKPALRLRRKSNGTVSSLVVGLKELYMSKLKGIEETYAFEQFYSPCLTPSDFEGKPSVLLLGQYSTGKTTFIKFLLDRSYPGSNIGPEPTTDRFTVVMHGYEDCQIPGNTLTVSPTLPYQSLHHFGTGFLSRLEGAQCDADVLHSVSLVDTPGVLSGEKQRIERAYDFVKVCRWFASRADVILLLFDPNKLDISDEFKEVITSLTGNEEKVRVCLNKADSIDQQQLLRVYGALMWSLGKVMNNPEVVRVYVGSFNGGHPVRTDVNPHGEALFKKEQEDLLEELMSIPQKSCNRKVSELVKRVRALRVHLLLLQHLKKQMPVLMFKQSSAAKILEAMPEHFLKVQQMNRLAEADFPNVRAFTTILQSFGLEKLPKVTDKHLRMVDEAINSDIPKLVRQFSPP